MSRRVTDEEREDWEEETGQRPRRLRTAPPKPEPKTAKATKPQKMAASPPLELLDKRAAARLFTTKKTIEVKLDLHGMTQDEAHAALRRFITRAHAQGKRRVAVITGKGSRGEGVLRRAVPRWLELPELRPLISSITHATPEKGGEGVLHLLLKKS